MSTPVGRQLDLVRAFLDSGLPREAAFSESEYRERVDRVRVAMSQAGLDVLLVHHMPNICYLTGYETPMADWYSCLLVPLEGDITLQVCDVALAVMHTHLTDIVRVRWDTMGQATEQTVELLRRLDVGRKRVGVETRRSGLSPYTYEYLRKALLTTHFEDASDVVTRVRVVKSAAEIECLRRAAGFTVAGMRAAIAAITPGASENAIAAAASEAMISAGSEFFSIDPHVRGGFRSSMAHATFRRHVIQRGDTVILEMGGVYQRYTAPLYCTAVVGTPSARLKRLADTCLATLELLYESIKPGRTMDEVARIAARGLLTADPGAEVVEYHAYSVGLGFPPDWVEQSVFIRPGAQEVLQPGMTFHTPRSLRIPGVMSAGFSETILVTETGCERLTSHTRELAIA